MTNIIAYTALHYGRDYLASAIRSVIDHVDTYYVLYAAEGSHGHHTSVPCPETREELYSIASDAAGAKLRWFDGAWPYEGMQRDTIFQLASDADVIVTVDYDEIYQDGLLPLAIETAIKCDIRGWRLPFRHYWRSFSKCVLYDPAYPVRVVKPRGNGDETLASHGLAINHFGYAIRPETMAYKWKIHGHHNELRRDCDWYNDVFMANRQTDTHPVGSEWWNPETVNPDDYLPSFMHEHPFWGKAVIE